MPLSDIFTGDLVSLRSADMSDPDFDVTQDAPSSAADQAVIEQEPIPLVVVSWSEQGRGSVCRNKAVKLPVDAKWLADKERVFYGHMAAGSADVPNGAYEYCGDTPDGLREYRNPLAVQVVEK
jgi:hypothetical protein